MEKEKQSRKHERPARALAPKDAALNHDHSLSLKRLNRIQGQLEGVSRMIQEKKYCLEILQQLRAAGSAMKGLEGEILRGHLRGCVSRAFESKDAFDVNDKIEEVIELWNKREI